MDTHLAKIQTARAIAPGIYDFTLYAPQLAKEARPGQFVHIRLPGHTLRRPISICSASAAEGTVRLVFAVRGEGTRALAAMGREETLDLLGPLGNSFMPECPRSKFGSVRPEAESACGDGTAVVPEFIQSKCGGSRPEAGSACGDGAACDPELARNKFGSVRPEAESACGDGAAVAPEFTRSKFGSSLPEAGSACGDGAVCDPELARSKFGSVRPEAESACGDGAAVAPEFTRSKFGSVRPETENACGDGAACAPEFTRSKFGSVRPEAGGACGDGAACAPEFIQSKCGGSRPEAESACGDGAVCDPELARSKFGSVHPEAGSACGDGAACAPEKSRSADGRVMLVGGGIGVPPMLFLAQALHGDCIAVLGFRSAESAILAEEFRALGCDTRIATEDGSLGEKGFVTDCFPQSGISAIAACGPVPMLRAVASYAKARAIPCAVSLEARMACGVGACLGCACSLLRVDGTAYYGHVCKDGPVFDAARVAWEGAQA